jgi:LysM repeat protein
VDANALVMNEGGQISDVYLGRFSTIVKPLAIPAAAPPSHNPITYTVTDGDTVSSIAKKHNLPVEAVRWSNPWVYEWVGAGQKVVLPPTTGLVYTVQKGDTIDSIGAAYHVDSEVIVDFNRINDPAALAVGTLVVVPGGVGPEYKAPVILAPRVSVSRFTEITPGNYSTARFPWGYCTWYVASKRPVAWLGNAYQWVDNARAMGYATGPTPAVGAVMVTWESGLGHVAFVESVNADGTFTVSEMNFRGFGVVSTRTIRVSQVPLIAFIY